MKKLIALLLALVMVVGLVACGAKEEAATETPATAPAATQAAANAPADGEISGELELAIFEGGYAGFWETYIAEFQAKYPGVTLTVDISPTMSETLRTRMMTDDVPDFVAMNLDTNCDPRVLAKEGQLYDLTNFVNTKEYEGTVLKDLLMEGTLDAGTVDGKNYLLPQNINMQGLFYNKLLLDQLGVEAPDSYEDLLAIGEVLESSNLEGVSLMTYPGIYPGYCMTGFFTASLEGIWDDVVANTPDIWKSAEVVKILQAIQTMAEKGYIDKGTPALNHTQAQQDFLTGKALFLPNGDWLENEMKDTELVNFEWGFVPCLKLSDSAKSCVTGGVDVMFVPAKADNPELAMLFMEGIYEEQNIKLYAEKAGATAPVKGVTELIPEFFSDSYKAILKANEEAGAAITIFDQPDVLTPVFDEVANQITNIVTGVTTAEEAAQAISDIASGIDMG